MMTKAKLIPDVHKIAVLRANALGDFILTLPALDALRHAYPEAEIVLLAKAWHAAFLQGRPSPVNRVVTIPTYGGVNASPETVGDPAEVEQFFMEMQQECFDLALQLHGGGRYSNQFVQRLKARVTAGLKSPEAAPLDRWIPYMYFQHEILRHLETVALVGAASTTLVPRIAVTPEDLAEAAHVVPENDQLLVVLHPGANDIRRRWSPENFAAVGDALDAAGAHVVVTGSAEEYDLAETVVQAMQKQAHNLSAKLSIGGFAGLLSRCRMLVSNDTGPAHLAEAVGAATVGIYWCGNMITFAPLTRTKHRQAISWRINCPVCGRDNMHTRCQHQVSFLDDVSVDEVRQAALDLFALP
jgi:ADP-heptose:LPS heptosyltransferase